MIPLTEARQTIANALSAVRLNGYGLTVSPYRTNSPRVGTAWVVLRQVRPATIRRHAADFEVVLALGSDERYADELSDELSTQIIDALTRSRNPLGSVVVSPVTIPTDSSGPLYGLAVSLTMEVTP